MFILRILTLLLVILPWSSVAIYNGSPANSTEFPFMVQVRSVTYDEGNSCMCGGSIVSPNIIVTAAHCVQNKTRASDATNESVTPVVNIIAGASRWGKHGPGSQTRTVKQILVHEAYNKTWDANDIAVLVLMHPLEFDNFVRPIRVPQRNHTFGLEGKAEICGFGLTGSNSSDVLQKATARIVPKLNCGVQIRDFINDKIRNASDAEKKADLESEKPIYYNLTNGAIICVQGYNTSSACKGDSGSPLIYTRDGHDYLFGVASLTIGQIGCNKSVMPNVYTNVPDFSDWINDKIAEFNFTCGSTDFNCGDGTCVSMKARCDRTVNCLYGTDELGCDACPKGQFLCTTKFKCIDVAYVCDRTNDCGNDGSDEVGCPGCSMGEFKCRSDSTCIHKRGICDGMKDCSDASDECGCGECNGDQFQCTNGQCVPIVQVCDGRNSCRDGSDELGCPKCPDHANCTNPLPYVDDLEPVSCWNLEFGPCKHADGCVFNNQTRECMAEKNLIGIVGLRRNWNGTVPETEAIPIPLTAYFVAFLGGVLQLTGLGYVVHLCVRLGYTCARKWCLKQKAEPGTRANNNDQVVEKIVLAVEA